MLNSKKARILVAASGQGRSLENLLAAQEQSKTYEIVGLVSNKQNCGAVTIANKAGLCVYTANFSGSAHASLDFSLWIESIKVDLIVLAGFLKVFPINFGSRCWENRIVNIHPSLLPAYGGKGMYGLKVHQAVVDSKAEKSGASIHFVNEEYDRGAIIAQSEVILAKDEKPESLARKVFDIECQLYPLVIEGLVTQELPLVDGGIKRFGFDGIKQLKGS